MSGGEVEKYYRDGHIRKIAEYCESDVVNKSTITDAIEWSIKGRVDHLWREDCKEASLRNVLLNERD
jgi:hypothetical protein